MGGAHKNQPESVAAAKGWDFGAVEAFKGAFNKAADVVHKQTVGRAQTLLNGCGVDLSDEAIKYLGGKMLKVGESFLMPIPADELVINLDANKVSLDVDEYKVKLDGVALRGLEVWIYNITTWEGPTAQLAELAITSLNISGEGFSLKGSLSLKQLKLQAEAGNMLSVVARVCGGAMKDTIKSYLPTCMKGGISAAEAVKSPGMKANFQKLVQAQLSGALSAGVKITLGSLEVKVDEIFVQDVGMGGGKVTAEGVSLGAKADKGKGIASLPTGSIEVDLAGVIQQKVDDFTIGVEIKSAKAAAADHAQMMDSTLLMIEKIDAEVRIDGALSGTAVGALLTVVLDNLTLEASINKGTLLQVFVGACGKSLTTALKQVKENPQAAKELFSKTLVVDMRDGLKDALTRNFKAAVSKIEVTLKKSNYGDFSVSGGLSAENVKVSVDQGAKGAQTKVEVEGEIQLHNVLVENGDNQFLRVSTVEVTLDDKGSGKVEGKFVLEGPALARMVKENESKAIGIVLNLLMKKTDPLTFFIPINDYKVDLAGVTLGMPKHKMITAGIKSVILDKIRISDAGEWKLKGPRPKIAPTMLGKVGKGTTDASLGVTEAQSKRDPVLIPKQDPAGGAKGMVNLQAFMQHTAQNKIHELLA